MNVAITVRISTYAEMPSRDGERNTERPHEPRGQPGPSDRAQRPAYADDAEESLALLQREPVRHERPEHHRGEQVEDAEPDEEHHPAHLADRLRRGHEDDVEAEEAEGEEQVGGRDEDLSPVAAHQQREHWIHR